MAKLDNAAFQKLTAFISPYIPIERERLELVKGIVGRTNRLANRIDYGGDATGFSTHLVKMLEDYGLGPNGENYVLLLVEHVIKLKEKEAAEEAAKLASQSAQIAQTAPVQPVQPSAPIGGVNPESPKP